MTEPLQRRQSISLSENFFCDGHYYVLTSASLGGSNLQPADLSHRLAYPDDGSMQDLLNRGVCLPLCFDGDCALDQKTLVVIGDLTEQEEHDWIGHLSGNLNIPCGKFIILCGGGDPDELAYALSGQPPKPSYEIFQVIDVSPGEYLVEVYAYLSSMTVQVSLEDYDADWNLVENEPLKHWYEEHQPGQEDVGYIIRLTPLQAAPPLPSFVPEIGWCGVFELRKPDHLA